MKVRLHWGLMKKTNLQEREIEREESITFTRSQFDRLLKKNLKMPVSVLHL